MHSYISHSLTGGFSARVVGALQEEGVDFSSVNVLDYPDIREGGEKRNAGSLPAICSVGIYSCGISHLHLLLIFIVKKFSEWPTIPQLYVNGEFIGGCDIVMQMHEAGELKDLLAKNKKT